VREGRKWLIPAAGGATLLAVIGAVVYFATRPAAVPPLTEPPTQATLDVPPPAIDPGPALVEPALKLPPIGRTDGPNAKPPKKRRTGTGPDLVAPPPPAIPDEASILDNRK